MEQEVQILDVLKAFEPTGFSSGASVVLGSLALIFIVSLFSLFGYMMVNLILPMRRRANEFDTLITDLEKISRKIFFRRIFGTMKFHLRSTVYNGCLQNGMILQINAGKEKLMERCKLHTFEPPDHFFLHINPPPKGFCIQSS